MVLIGRCIVLLRLLLSQHSTWTALVAGFRLPLPGLTHKRRIRGGFGRGGLQNARGCCSVAAGYHKERNNVLVCVQAEPQCNHFFEGAREDEKTGEAKRNEIADVTKYLRERMPELFSFDKEYKGPTQVRRNPLSNYYYPLEHPDMSVQLHPSCGDPGYEEGGYNDVIGVLEENNCKATTITLPQAPTLPQSNDNPNISSLITQNGYLSVEREGSSTKEEAENLPAEVVDTVEASRRCTQEQKMLTFTGNHAPPSSFLPVVKGNKTSVSFETRSRCSNAVTGSWNIANGDVNNPYIPAAAAVAEQQPHSVEMGALDALLEKQMKNCRGTNKNVEIQYNEPVRSSTSQVNCSRGQMLPVTAPENIGADFKEKNSATASVDMTPSGGDANDCALPLLTPIIQTTDSSLFDSDCGLALEANGSSTDSDYGMRRRLVQEKSRERQEDVQSLKYKQQILSSSPSVQQHHSKMEADNMDDNAIADTIDATTKHVMKGLLADTNSTVFTSAPLFPPPKNIMDTTYMSSVSNIRMGHPIEIAGVWQIDGLLLMRENCSVATGLAEMSLTERDPQDNLVLRIDGQVSGGPVIDRKAVARWSDPKGCRSSGGRWAVYKDERGVTRLRIILFGNQEKTIGIALDGTVLMMREWDQMERRHVDVPHIVGHVSEVEERECVQDVQGRAMAQRKLGECSLCKIYTGGLDRLSLTVPEPKSILT